MKPLTAKDISQTLTALADQLASEMQTIAGKAMKSQSNAIAKALKAGDFQEAQQLAQELDFSDTLLLSKTRVLKFSRASALAGAGAVDKPANTIFASGAPFPPEVDKTAVEAILKGVGKALVKNTRRALERKISAASTFQKAASIDPADLANDINKFLRGEIRRVVNVGANITGTRVAAHGMFYEARVRGIAQYRLDAVRDENTTEICRHLDGKVFSIEEAFTRSGKVLGITDPETMKREAPFPPQKTHEIEKLAELSDEELQARGFDTPPFHFLCRTVVTLIRSDTEYDPVAWSDFPTLKQTKAATRVMRPKYEREARKLFKNDDLDDLFDQAQAATQETNKVLDDVTSYTGNAFNNINDSLRRNVVIPSDNLAIAKTMDDLFTRNGANAPTTTYSYRGLSAKVADQLKVGKVFQDDAFMSVSLTPDVAAEFVQGNGAILQIQIGKGQKVLPIFPASSVVEELELILPRGSQLRIIGVSTADDIPVFRAVLQGQGTTLPLDKIGIDTILDSKSLIKAETKAEAKFGYAINDLREASFN